MNPFHSAIDDDEHFDTSPDVDLLATASASKSFAPCSHAHSPHCMNPDNCSKPALHQHHHSQVAHTCMHRCHAPPSPPSTHPLPRLSTLRQPRRLDPPDDHRCCHRLTACGDERGTSLMSLVTMPSSSPLPHLAPRIRTVFDVETGQICDSRPLVKVYISAAPRRSPVTRLRRRRRTAIVATVHKPLFRGIGCDWGIMRRHRTIRDSV